MAKILAVDDSPAIRLMVSSVLKKAGHEVTSAEDGVEASRVADGDAFELVITDVHMPNMNGIELIQCLRGKSAYRHTPLLVLTTESSQEMKQRGRAAGATGWIVKPFDPASLVNAVSRVLGA
ncbi:MAG: response regulator [Pseudomonadota bacterium]